MKTSIVLLLLVIFLAGCEGNYRVITASGPKYMTLDEAISYGRNLSKQNTADYWYLEYLNNMRNHAPNDYELSVIDKEIARVEKIQETSIEKSDQNLK
jgi:hypothetical protein